MTYKTETGDWKEVKAERAAQLPIIGKKPESDKEEAFLREICEYEFMNMEEPGMIHMFTYGNAKNKERFRLFHGARYKMPRFLARHLESCGTPIYKWLPTGSGTIAKQHVGTNSRFQMRQVYSA